MYSDNKDFWNHIVSCFRGLIGRRYVPNICYWSYLLLLTCSSSLNPEESVAPSEAYNFFLCVTDTLLGLGERLLHTEVAVLKQNVARRDSTSSPTSTTSPKHSLQFPLWPQTFMDMAIRSKEFLEPMSRTYRFSVRSVVKQSVERFQGSAMDAVVTLLELIASRLDNIKSPFATAYPYMDLCYSVLFVDPSNTGDWLTPYFGKLVKIFELVYGMTIHDLPKHHLDENSQRVIELFRVPMVEMLRALYHTENVSPEFVYRTTMEDVVKCRIIREELLIPPEDSATPAVGNSDLESRIMDSLRKVDILEVALIACSLEFYNALSRSSSVDLRNRAAYQIGYTAWDIHINKQEFRADYQQLLQNYTAKFLLAKDIMGYLLGPQSHATLIGRTTAIVAFMAATNTLTRRDADMIWSISFNSQQPDDAQSAIEVLKIIPRWMPPFTKGYFCNKFRDLPLSRFTRDAEVLLQTLMTEFARTSTDGEYESTYTCIRLLSKIEDPDISPNKQNILMGTFGNLLLTINSPRSTEETLRLIELCATPIASLSEKATGYAHALFCILQQKNCYVQPREVYGLLSFQKCVEELTETLRRAKRDARLLGLYALRCRLELMAHILSISSPSDNTAESEKTLCQYVLADDASAPVLRNAGWRFFLECFQANHPQLQAFNRRFINQYLPQISPELATIETTNFFRIQYARLGSDENVLLPLDEQLIRFALAVPLEELAKPLMNLLMERLFKGKAIRYHEWATRRQIFVVRQLVAQIARQGVPATRAAEILLWILVESDQFRAALDKSTEAVSGEVSQKRPDLPQDSIQIPIRIHKGNGQPQSKTVTINKSANCLELHAAIASEIGFANYTVVSAGRKIDFSEKSEQSITQLGLGEGKVLLVQKRSTFESIQEDVSKRAERSVIEEETVSHLNVFYGILDDSSRKAQFVLQILEWLKFPGPVRAMIAAPETPFEQIFPPRSSLRLRASIEVLSLQLKEQVALGVADEKFLVRGVHLLVELLCQSETQQEITNLLRAAETLLELLRERPVNDVTAGYFTDGTRFAHQVLHHIGQFSDNTATVDRDSIQHSTIRALYHCLLESVVLSNSVCSAFIAADAIVPVHLRLLSTGNGHLRATIPRIIANAIQDERCHPEIRSFFSKLSLNHLIPAALEQPLICDNVFLVSHEAISADQKLASDEGLLRSLIDRFANTLLEMRHLERYGVGFVDMRVSGFVSLIHCCVQKLVTQNKALDLGNLASQLFKTLLFPHLHLDKTLCPVISLESRNAIYDLLRLMCDNTQTVEELSEDCEAAADDCPSDQSINFTGPDTFIRREGDCAGLANLGQTCYFNSLLQQLFMNVQFRKFIFDTPVLDSKKQTVLAELQLAFASMQDSHDIFYQPDDLVKALNVDSSVQDDAHIFFMTLIGQLEESMPDDEAKDALKSFFRGINKSQTIGSCKHVSESTDEYFNLSLVVKDKASLEESLEEYTKGATLEGSDKFRCTTCGTGEGVSVDAVQRTAFEHVPDNLVLGLRRFRYETYDGGQKVNDRFDFPERIDMSKYKLNRLAGVEGTSESDVFQLVGVVVHQGILTFGHYWSYAAERGRGDAEPLRWFRFEDKNVRRASIEEVLGETRGGLARSLSTSVSRDQSPCLRSDNAYVLFYQRASSISEFAKCLASSTSILPYVPQARASLPQDMEDKIRVDNAKKILHLHLFSMRHVEFVNRLPGKLDTLKSPNPTTCTRVTYRLMSMSLRYYTRVIASFDTEFAPQSIDFASLQLQKLACHGIGFAKWLLKAILPRRSGDDKSRSIGLHYKRTVRLATNRLIVGCLRYLREHDPKYVDTGDEDGIMASTIQGLISLHPLLLERAPVVWSEYFELVRGIAELGPEETWMLLEHQFLRWSFEVLFIKDDSDSQKKHPEIMRYMANNSRAPNYAAIINCIYGLLYKFVDLRGYTMFSGGSRWTNTGMLLLTGEEHEVLLENSRSGINWIVEHCMQGLESSKRVDWREWPPTKLIVLLTDANRVPQELYNDAIQTLVSDMGCGTDWDMISESVLLCLTGRKMKSSTEEAIFQEMDRILASYQTRRSENSEAANFLWILSEVYKVQPLMMFRYLARLTISFLVCDNAQVERDARNWLRDSVLVQNVLSKPYILHEVRVLRQRISSIKELLIGLGDRLTQSLYKPEKSSYHEYSIDAYQDCSTYLSQVSSRLEMELKEWLKSEAPEDEYATELETAVQELFDDISSVDGLLRNQEDLRDRIRDWKEERSSSEALSNSNIVEIDDGESWHFA
jgi:ubiquitin C-terminal hydrolase